MKKEFLGLRLEEVDKKELFRIARLEGMTGSKLAVLAIKKYIADWKKKAGKGA